MNTPPSFRLARPIILSGILTLMLFRGANGSEDAANYHTFTNTSGRSVEARLEKAEGGEVTISVRSGQVYVIPLDSLSAEDQAYVQEWKQHPPASSPAPAVAASVTSEVSLDKVNELLGHPLFADGNLWENDPAAVAKRLKWPEESKTTYSSSYRKYAGKDDRLAGARPYSLALYGEDGKVTNVSIVFANKGDYFGAAGRGEAHFIEGKKVPGGIEGLRQVMKNDAGILSSTFTSLLGEPEQQKFGEGESRRWVDRWDWNGHAFLLSQAEDEYVSLSIEPASVADNRGQVSRQSDAEIRERAHGNLEKRENGDVVITNFPMVDQGPKGYCVPATVERCLRYLGVPADMYLLAMTGNSNLGGGTNPMELLAAISTDVKRKGRDIDIMEKELKLRDLARYLDDGIPVMWTLQSTQQFNQIANQRTKERKTVTDWAAWKERMREISKEGAMVKDYGRGHIVIIIGYNEESDEIAFSDSWGKGYEERWITIGEAAVVSENFLAVIDL